MAAIYLLQAPFTQLNAPYPAIHYLKAFLSARGLECRARDLAIESFHAIFSAKGLTKIFSDAQAVFSPERLAHEDQTSRLNIIRYLSNQSAYLECIDPLISFLCGRNPDYAHFLADPGRIPYGFRVERYLEDVDGAPDAARMASLIVEDLADFISYALDRDFSLVRYAESKASSQGDFGQIQQTLSQSYIIREFIRPLAAAALADYESSLVCVSVPFPGCLAPALAILEEAKRLGLSTAMGGGYVSTELRYLRDASFFDSVDYLCFDAGFGALASIIDDPLAAKGLYRVMRRQQGRISIEGFPEIERADYPQNDGPEWKTCPEEAVYAEEEGKALAHIFPDYSDAELKLYLRIDDSDNPMHSLWSKGIWLKCRLAYGCYWAKCRFCDTNLDYIRRYAPAPVAPLFHHMLDQAKKTSSSGLHFVDEAAPVPLLLDFAMENARAGRPLSFWGNTRFEPLFSRDRAEFLAWAGFLAASAGIEVAGEKGLSLSGKGLSMGDIVSACDNLSRAGILVHAYLMHGLPGQGEGDIIDSLEIVRQMFRLGLIHSAFWHPFQLTRHSPFCKTMLAEGKTSLPNAKFALNDLEWKGSAKLGRYSEGLEKAMASFMDGDGWEAPVSTWFDFKTPEPSPAKDYVKALRGAGRLAAAKEKPSPRSKAMWIGGKILISAGAAAESGGTGISWSYRNEILSLGLKPDIIPSLLSIVEGLDPRATAARTGPEVMAEIEALGDEGPRILTELRQGGLLFI